MDTGQALDEMVEGVRRVGGVGVGVGEIGGGVFGFE